MYLYTLARYLRHFPGRTARYVEVETPQVSAGEHGWPTLLRALGLTGPPDLDDPVHLTPERLPALVGVADYVAPTYLGVRTADALVRFHGRPALGMLIAVAVHLYASTGTAECAKSANAASLRPDPGHEPLLRP